MQNVIDDGDSITFVTPDGPITVAKRAWGKAPVDELTGHLIGELVEAKDDDRRKLLALLETAPAEVDKARLRARLMELVQTEFSAKRSKGRRRADEVRGWLLSALARIAEDDKAAAEFLRSHLDPSVEPDAFVRYWLFAGLIATGVPDLEQIAQGIASSDPDPLVAHLAQAALAKSGDETALQALFKGLRDEKLRWQTLRALRIVPLDHAELVDQVARIAHRSDDKTTLYNATLVLRQLGRLDRLEAPQSGKGQPNELQTAPPAATAAATGRPLVPAQLVLIKRYEPPPVASRLNLSIHSHTAVLSFADKRYESPLRIDFTALKGIHFSQPDYGRALFQGIIHGQKSQGSNRESVDFGYRTALQQTGGKLSFELSVDTNDPKLRALKWEYLRDANGLPLAIREQVPFYRRVGDEDVPPVAPPLKVLVAISNPQALGKADVNRYLGALAPIDVGEQRRTVEAGLARLRAAGLAEYRILDAGSDGKAVTLELLSAALQEGYHVLHLLAHGFWHDNGHYCIALEREGGQALVPASDFNPALLGAQLRLVVLGICDSFSFQADGPVRGDANRLSLGLQLVEAGLPAVISMQEKLSFEAARFFAQHFYDDLARSGRVDMALAATRFDFYQSKAGGPWNWGIPVLHLGAKSGRLFRVDEAKAAALEPPPLPAADAARNDDAVQTAIERAAQTQGLSDELVERLQEAVRGRLAETGAAHSEPLAPAQDRVLLSQRLRSTLRLEAEALKVQVQASGFEVAGAVYRQVTSALNTGKHIVLIGPPGTGKTSLANEVCAYAASRGFSTGTVYATASADWTTFDTVGGYVPGAQQTLAFRPGLFLRAIRAGQWLVVDEINRAEIDKAVGELFTVLSGQPVELPYRVAGQRVRVLPPKGEHPADWVPDHVTGGYDYVVHPNWRIVATMNVYDKASLFALSFAFMRRFAFVDVGVPDENARFAGLRERWLERYRLADAAGAELQALSAGLRGVFRPDGALMRHRELGPAIAKDMIRYIGDRREQGAAEPMELLGEAFLLYAMPQLDGLARTAALAVYGHLDALFGGLACGAGLRRRLQNLYPHIPVEDWAGQGAPNPPDDRDGD